MRSQSTSLTATRLSSNLLLFSAACVAIGVLAAQSQDVPDWQTAAGGKMAFEVASVKPAKPEAFILPNFVPDRGDWKPPGGRFRAILPLGWYISFAYKLDQGQSDAMYAKLPKWANSSYLIEANADGNPTKDQMRLMMQSLLADRFKLRVHFDTREGPVLALELVEPGKPGPKLIPHSEGPPCPDFEVPDFSKPPQPPKTGVDSQPCGLSAGVIRGTSDGTWIGSRDAPPWLIAADVYTYGLSVGELDKPVVDRTGLTGMFDWVLEVGSEVMKANLVTQTPVVYPPLAKMAHVQGTVAFTATIAKDGSVQNLQLMSGPPLLVAAAQQSVSQWVYRPTIVNGNPVAVITTIEVYFTLAE